MCGCNDASDPRPRSGNSRSHATMRRLQPPSSVAGARHRSSAQTSRSVLQVAGAALAARSRPARPATATARPPGPAPSSAAVDPRRSTANPHRVRTRPRRSSPSSPSAIDRVHRRPARRPPRRAETAARRPPRRAGPGRPAIRRPSTAANGVASSAARGDRPGRGRGRGRRICVSRPRRPRRPFLRRRPGSPASGRQRARGARPRLSRPPWRDRVATCPIRRSPLTSPALSG
jgi:hypothetical protein